MSDGPSLPSDAGPADTPRPRCYALVPCAGVGERAGAGLPKQYAFLLGRPLVAHTLDALLAVEALEAVLVVLAPGDAHFGRLLPGRTGARAWVAACGGDSRAASVAGGLEELRRRGAAETDWVLVHDAARCALRPAWVERLVEACRGDAVGGLLALPVADTLKRAVPDAGAGQPVRAQATLERAGAWAAQTPQMFRIGLLQRALAAAGAAVTDEASAVEALGLQPRLVRGDARNLKVTWPEDFEHAEALLAAARPA